MQIAHRIAGYRLGEADLLRRAMSKKKPEEMAAQRARFMAGAQSQPPRKVGKVFDVMEQFAGYGFNKSHSAAYAYLAYVTAYLKAHYPVEFMAALLTSETGNTAKVVKYINECREMGIRVLPPDVNSSDWSFTPDGEAIRFGLGALKSLGQGAAEAIVAGRAAVGRFRSLDQFCERVDLGVLNKRVLESLIKAGAMDTLGGHRAQLMMALDRAMESGQRAWRDRLRGQTGLFSAAWDEHEAPEQPLPSVPEWSVKDRLAGEKEVLGLYVTGHPLDAFEEKIRDLATHSSDGLEGLAKGTEVTLCGLLTGIQRKRNKEGKPWASMQLEDRGGNLEALVFTTNFERLAPELVEDAAVRVRAQVLPEENAPPKISLQDIVPLEVARVDLPTLIAIRVRLNGGRDAAAALSELFQRKPGQTEVRLRLEKAREFSVSLDVPQKVRADREFCAEVERICGPETVEVLGS